jgi:hypothetical protein
LAPSSVAAPASVARTTKSRLPMPSDLRTFASASRDVLILEYL